MELIERLESAQAHDITTKDARDFADALGFQRPGPDYALCHNALQGSLDAALALAERVLPGWHWALSGPREPLAASDSGQPSASLANFSGRAPRLVLGVAPTPALALCIAILRATTAASESAVGMSPKGECTKKDHDNEG